MSHWNYRVIRFDLGPDSYSAIHEVHYNDDGKPVSYGANPAPVLWEDEGGGGEILAKMFEAYLIRALTPEDFQK